MIRNLFVMALMASVAACSEKAPEKADGSASPDAQKDAAQISTGEATGEGAGTDSAPAPVTDPYTLKNLAYLRDNAGKDGVVITESGLQYVVKTVGDGPTPGPEDSVTVHYRGRLIDGSEFDSSYSRGEPIEFSVNRVIPGWQEMLQLMPAGTAVEATIPSDLAYGDRAQGDRIPANSTLIFEMELLDVKSSDDVRDEALAPQQAFLDDYAKQDGVTVTESGLMYKVIEKGAGGKTPDATSIVTAHYRGKLIDGSEFDSSYGRGQPLEFPLDRVIPGWTEGLQLMEVGDVFELAVPYDLGYGPTGHPGVIPAYATLIFEVALMDTKTRAEADAEAQAAFEEFQAAQQVYLDQNAAKDGVTVTDSGLQIEWLARGDEGAEVPGPTSMVTVHYQGTFTDGEEFDSSHKRGRPASFPVDGVIAGWTEALQMMRVGDKTRLVIPAAIGYGARGSRSVPPGATLVFEVELLSIDN